MNVMTAVKELIAKNEPVISNKALFEILEDRISNETVWQNRPYTCIVLNSWYNRKTYTGFGFSKVCYPDPWDAENGILRARKRALSMILKLVRQDEPER